jgi:hypothetical protein
LRILHTGEILRSIRWVGKITDHQIWEIIILQKDT